MRVSRLEIFGFKSFRDRFVLNFDRDLIGIVGPNGCGKSNLVDALRWVLGETQAKKLRGTLQEDLIFNGSDTKRPLGMAEVSITLTPIQDGLRLLGLFMSRIPIKVDQTHRKSRLTTSLTLTPTKETKGSKYK